MPMSTYNDRCICTHKLCAFSFSPIYTSGANSVTTLRYVQQPDTDTYDPGPIVETVARSCLLGVFRVMRNARKRDHAHVACACGPSHEHRRLPKSTTQPNEAGAVRPAVPAPGNRREVSHTWLTPHGVF